MKRPLPATKKKPRSLEKSPTAKHNLAGKETIKPYKQAELEPKK